MNDKLQKLLESLVPFLILGFAAALVISLFIMLSYVLVWGLLIGAVLWGLYSIKNYLFPGETAKPIKSHKGRIIEHDDKK
ncbi:MAG: hypothetical protein LCH30_02095 [Proteobacteria bacterium]|nr:hypothetical protein [Pseudomonadota bacterium]